MSGTPENMIDEQGQQLEPEVDKSAQDVLEQDSEAETDTDCSLDIEASTEAQDMVEDILEPESDEAPDGISDDAPERTSDEAEPIPPENSTADSESETTIESVIEAVLFANDEPVTLNKLAMIVETTGKLVRESIARLNEKYEANHMAFRIEQIAGGLQMLTLPQYNHWLKKLIKVRGDSKLSPAALETLAIVAYKQPAIRADIEAIRGVASGEVLRSLMHKALVKMTGRAEVIGRPMQYGTTKKFLEVFGLNSLKDLPSIEELKKPSED
jgi:segregation and condensation protein B